MADDSAKDAVSEETKESVALVALSVLMTLEVLKLDPPLKDESEVMGVFAGRLPCDGHPV